MTEFNNTLLLLYWVYAPNSTDGLTQNPIFRMQDYQTNSFSDIIYRINLLSPLSPSTELTSQTAHSCVLYKFVF